MIYAPIIHSKIFESELQSTADQLRRI